MGFPMSFYKIPRKLLFPGVGEYAQPVFQCYFPQGFFVKASVPQGCQEFGKAGDIANFRRNGRPIEVRADRKVIHSDAVGDVTEMLHQITQGGVRVSLAILSQKFNSEIYS